MKTNSGQQFLLTKAQPHISIKNVWEYWGISPMWKIKMV